MERKLPVLLPAPAPRGEELPPPKKSDPRKRSGVSVACNTCRAKRVKCDGQRPQCSHCQLKELECIYTAQENETPAGALKRENNALKQKTADIAELFGLLRAMPEDQSFAVIRHIRSCNSEPADVVRQIKQGDFKSNSALSSVTTASAYLPQLLSSLELELLTAHPNAYPTLGPLDVGTVDLNLIGIPLRFRSKPETSRQDEFHQALSERRGPVDRFRQISPSASSQGSTAPTQFGPKPTPTGNLCDPLLSNVNAKYWTNIPVSNATVAGAISQYLMHEHPLSGFFDADLFIRDLVEPSTAFCSRLLFHALMAYACQGYSFYDNSAASLADGFYDEAVRQWHAESDHNHITTFSASLILFLASESMGRDADGVVFYQESVAIGSRLGIFGDSGEEQSSTSRSKGHAHITDMERFRSATAWGLLNWHTLHSFYGRQEPSILTTPSVAFPQHQENASYMGETFPILSQLQSTGPSHTRSWHHPSCYCGPYLVSHHRNRDFPTIFFGSKVETFTYIGRISQAPQKTRLRLPEQVRCLEVHFPLPTRAPLSRQLSTQQRGEQRSSLLLPLVYWRVLGLSRSIPRHRFHCPVDLSDGGRQGHYLAD